MAAALPYIVGASTLYGLYNQYQTGRRQDEYQRQLEREAMISPEEAAKYNALAGQLAYMAGIDPTSLYVRPEFGATRAQVPGVPELPETPFSAISDEAINEVIAQAQRDLSTQAGTLGEQALGLAARRGLAGSSLVDQALANIGSQSARELSRTRTQAELQAEELTRQYQNQALQMLTGLNPNDLQSLQAMAGVLTGLQNQLAGQQAGWGDLVSGGLGYLLNQFGPLANQTNTTTGDQFQLKFPWERQGYNPFQ